MPPRRARGTATAAVRRTERLLLRPPVAADAEALYAWASDPRMMEHMGRGPWSRAEVADAMERWTGHWREHGFGVWVVEELSSGEPIGRCGLSFHRAWPDDPEVGWWIAPERQGRGLATEAGRAAVAFGLETLGLARLVSICLEENLPSRRVMAKLGFEKLVEVRSPRFPGLVLWVHALDRRPADGHRSSSRAAGRDVAYNRATRAS